MRQPAHPEMPHSKSLAQLIAMQFSRGKLKPVATRLEQGVNGI